ncbi:hypothetical protein GEV33_005658 [Tenebrio molitor]|uniref:Uncharacterized protein n=1 Tax=Tenebrio molitor TaxID=7067 RepID=A0A8J6LF70_TENMO|nr:hypothetical protein GEV33_005658 [Tenebrio molitor]
MPFERFIKVFRLGKEEVQLLIEELADFNDNVGGRRDKIPFYMKVLIFLNFVGSGSFQTGVEEEEEEEEENDEDDEEMPIVDNNINILMEGRLVRQQKNQHSFGHHREVSTGSSPVGKGAHGCINVVNVVVYVCECEVEWAWVAGESAPEPRRIT